MRRVATGVALAPRAALRGALAIVVAGRVADVGACSRLEPLRLYVSPTPALRFDIRKHEMEKRRLRELEKAGINPDDDDAPWIAPEEQQRLDEEEQARQAEEEQRRQQFLAKRAEEDAVKRQKFKEFRAKQIAMSRRRKEAAADHKEARKEHRGGREQVDEVDGGEEAGATPAEGDEMAEATEEVAPGKPAAGEAGVKK